MADWKADISVSFQSTPSVGRATRCTWLFPPFSVISIHALRGEGDGSRYTLPKERCYFNPRPPWGGRPRTSSVTLQNVEFQSTPSVGRATLIHKGFSNFTKRFQSTPSVGRATANFYLGCTVAKFQSTPSVGRATLYLLTRASKFLFQSTPSVGRATTDTEEQRKENKFQSTPSVGRATLIGGNIGTFVH